MNQYFYEQDEKRLEMMKDSLTKYFIYEISRIRNLQYDSENITKVIFFKQIQVKIYFFKKLEAITLENDNIFLKNQEITKIVNIMSFYKMK